MADISKIKLPNNSEYDIKDSRAVRKAGDTMTGNLVVPSERIANTYYGVSFGRTTSTPVETILYTGIKWVSSSHMPVVHITGYAYGLQSPVEFKVGFYIYGGSIGYCGVTNMGSWSPDVYLFKYVRESVEYVAIGLAGSCYFLQLQADIQDEMGKFANVIVSSDAWSWSFLTTAGTIPTPDSGVTCIKVPYKANILKPANATKADSATTSDTSGGINHKPTLTSETVDNFHDSLYMKFANITGYSGKGLVGSDGILVWIPYNTNFGRQLIFDDTGKTILSRAYNNGTWSDWVNITADASTSQKGVVKLNTATNSTSTTEAATPSAVKTAYDLANTANGTANTALSGVNGTLIYDHTYSISNGVATFTAHVYQKGVEVTSSYADSCFSWSYKLANAVTGTPSVVSLGTGKTKTITISTLGYGGYVLGTFTPPSA